MIMYWSKFHFLAITSYYVSCLFTFTCLFSRCFAPNNELKKIHITIDFLLSHTHSLFTTKNWAIYRSTMYFIQKKFKRKIILLSTQVSPEKITKEANKSNENSLVFRHSVGPRWNTIDSSFISMQCWNIFGRLFRST